jgi:hypothetical protein
MVTGGPDSSEIVIQFEGRAAPVNLALYFTQAEKPETAETADPTKVKSEESGEEDSDDDVMCIQPLFDGGAWAGSMVWDGRFWRLHVHPSHKCATLFDPHA